MRYIRLFVTLLLLVCSANVYPQEARFWRVLLPIVVNEPGLAGAHGSMFVTSLSVFNANDATAVVAQRPLPCPFECYPIEWPGKSVALPIVPTAAAGTYIYVADFRGGETIDPKKVVFSLRAQDVTRQALTFGTALPVVRDDQFSSRIDLLGIPLDARFRQTIRIYDLEARDTDVFVRVYPMDPTRSTELLGERRLSLVAPKPQPSDFPRSPAFAQLGDVAIEFPEVRGVEPVRIEITAADGTTRTWAFASITHNETQHITLITP